jgi:putative chitinase
VEVKAIDVVAKFAPKAQPGYSEAFRAGDNLIEQYNINTPRRLAHFMTQILYETGDLRALRENGRYNEKNLARIWDRGSWHKYFADREACIAMAPINAKDGGVTLFNLVYGERLGNGPPETGDGWKYRGGGLMQTTGKRAYARYGKIFQVDFVGAPELIHSGAHALKPALHEWKEGNLNVAADDDDIEVISRRINGSLKSVAERRAKFAQLWAFIGAQDKIEESIEWQVQERLRAAGFPKLKIDGVIGPESRHAILTYRTGEHLRPGLGIDDELLGSLGLDELARITRAKSASAQVVAKSGDGDKVPKLIQLGSTPAGLAAARADAAKRLDIYPRLGCAAHLSALLNRAGVTVEPTRGAQRLVDRLEDRGWTRVDLGNQLPGDVGVTYDRDPSRPGADHVYLVIQNFDGDKMMIADNQNDKDSPHERWASGRGKTRTSYFLRA